VSDIRLFLAISYAVLLFWRGRIEGGVPAYWWMVILGYFLLIQLTHWSEAVYRRWQVRRVVHMYRAMDPVTQRMEIQRIWMAGARFQLRRLLEAEGAADTSSLAESYPFAVGAKRAVGVIFWVTATAAALCLGALVVGPRRVPAHWGWPLWALATALIFVAAALRIRTRHLESMLELTPYAISETWPDGARRTIRWGGPLLLRYRRWLRRLELSVPGQATVICLDLDRIGIDRAVRLTLEYGRFQVPANTEGDAA
jgi:hypothetical protein